MSFLSFSSSMSVHFRVVSFLIPHLLILPTEYDLGGMGGLLFGGYFLGKGGLVADDGVDPLGWSFSLTTGFLNGLCVRLMVENA